MAAWVPSQTRMEDAEGALSLGPVPRTLARDRGQFDVIRMGIASRLCARGLPWAYFDGRRVALECDPMRGERSRG